MFARKLQQVKNFVTQDSSRMAAVMSLARSIGPDDDDDEDDAPVLSCCCKTHPGVCRICNAKELGGLFVMHATSPPDPVNT